MFRSLSLCALFAACICLAGLAADSPATDLPGSKPANVCGDANADRRLDISDAIRVLAHIFTGGPPPICREQPAPPCEPVDSLRQWIAEKGIPTVAVTPVNVLALEGTDLDILRRRGIEPGDSLSSVFITTDDGDMVEVPLVFIADPLDLLYLALEAAKEGGKLKVTHTNSTCTKPITCNPLCVPLLPPFGKTHVKEEKIGAEKRFGCEPADKGECTESLVDVCKKTYYENDKCEKEISSFTRRDPVCEP